MGELGFLISFKLVYPFPEKNIYQRFFADASLVCELPDLRAKLSVHGEIMPLRTDVDVKLNRLVIAELRCIMCIPEFTDFLVAMSIGNRRLIWHNFVSLYDPYDFKCHRFLEITRHSFSVKA